MSWQLPYTLNDGGTSDGFIYGARHIVSADGKIHFVSADQQGYLLYQRIGNGTLESRHLLQPNPTFTAVTSDISLDENGHPVLAFAIKGEGVAVFTVNTADGQPSETSDWSESLIADVNVELSVALSVHQNSTYLLSLRPSRDYSWQIKIKRVNGRRRS